MSGAFFYLIIALLLVFLLYQGGLSGRFHLDDTPNLQYLASNDAGLLNYLVNAPVGGSHRPFSYLTFFFQKASYPSDPGAFLRVNLGIHLLNTILFYWLIIGLARARALSRPELLGTVAAVFWSLLPIHVSVVLYVVQRMTLLSTTFVLLACAGYVHERLRMGKVTWGWRSALRLSAWVFIGYLGILAKENAILVGLALALIEVFFLTSSENPSPPRWWRWVAFYFPFVLLASYLLLVNPVMEGYATRDFTLSERLWTEARVMWDYLKLILFPDLNDLSLYHDDFPISRSIGFWEGVALGGWLLVSGIIFFRNWQGWALSFAFAWYLAMHLLESTVVPLEIYFEHRNYLPSVGLVIGGAFAIHELMGRVAQISYRRFLLLVLGLYCGWLAMVTFIEARTWGDPMRFVAETRYKHPQSLRATEELAAFLAARGNFQAAYQVFRDWKRRYPEHYTPGIDLRIMMLSCYAPTIPFRWNNDLAKRFRTGKLDLSVDVLKEVLDRKLKGDCKNISWRDFIDTIDAFLANPRYRKHAKVRFFLQRFLAFAYLAGKAPQRALQVAMTDVDMETANFDYLLLIAVLADEADDRVVFERVMAVVEQKKPPSFFMEKEQLDLLRRLEKAVRGDGN